MSYWRLLRKFLGIMIVHDTSRIYRYINETSIGKKNFSRYNYVGLPFKRYIMTKIFVTFKIYEALRQVVNLCNRYFIPLSLKRCIAYSSHKIFATFNTMRRQLQTWLINETYNFFCILIDKLLLYWSDGKVLRELPTYVFPRKSFRI